MRFHWFYRTNISVSDLKELSKTLEDVGYYSILLVYHSKMHDMILPSFGASDNNQKLKYLVALRTYAISPEYASMICKSYNEAFPNKLILNVCSGDIHSDETTIDDVVFIKNLIDTNEKRRKYTKEWLSKFTNLSKNTYLPEIIMGGHSNETKNICKEFNATNLSAGILYKEYCENKDRVIFDKQMIQISIVIRDSDEEAFNFANKYGVDGHNRGDALKWIVYGTKDTVKKKIIEYKEMGATDILISYFSGDSNISGIHDMIKELVAEEKWPET